MWHKSTESPAFVCLSVYQTVTYSGKYEYLLNKTWCASSMTVIHLAPSVDS